MDFVLYCTIKSPTFNGIIVLVYIITAGTTPATCGDPGTPVSGTKIGSDYRIGATVYYECDSGYRLEGTGSRQCQHSGIWTGELPQCVEQGKWLKYSLILYIVHPHIHVHVRKFPK